MLIEFLKVYGLQLPREPHRSSRLLQLTERWQHVDVDNNNNNNNNNSNNNNFKKLNLLLTAPKGATQVN